MNQLGFAFHTDAQRTAAVGEHDHQQRFVAVVSLIMAVAVVATMAFGFHKSSATARISAVTPASVTAASAGEPGAAMPVAHLDAVVIRPTVQQLAELEQLRKARLARSGPTLAPAGVIAGAVTAGAGL